MENTLIANLKSKIQKLRQERTLNAITQRNIIKEELHYYVLNFIYNHPEYSKWTMYGGSALRICHDLDRMSIDLDFEVKKLPNLKELKKELLDYFKKDYNIDSSTLSISINKDRGLLLKFKIARELKLGTKSPKVHIKIDLNEFQIKDVKREKIPVSSEKWSPPFVIKTYNLSGLMASKIAAVLGRKDRKRGKKTIGYKPEDIYDLIWYMERKIVPDLDYLKAKDLEFNDVKELFDKLTIEVLNLKEDPLKRTLPSRFLDQKKINYWLKNWRDLFRSYKDKYQIHKVTKIKEIRVYTDFKTDNRSIFFIYNTESSKPVKIIFKLSDYFFELQKINYQINKEIMDFVFSKKEISEKSKKYISLFFKKGKEYLKKTNHIILGNHIETKLIRATAKNLNHQTQILLDQSTLKSCKLEDLLK